MKKVKKTVLMLIFLFVCFITSSVGVFALDVSDVNVTNEIDLPEDLCFSESDVASRYDYFNQVTAREDGCFAVYARQVDMDNPNNNDFEKVFIDLYDSDGNFIKELSFSTPASLVIELTQETLNIYFYQSVLVYNLDTKDLKYYSASEKAVDDSGVFDRLRVNEFECGKWKYSCKKTNGDYTELVRNSGDEAQILLITTGTGLSFWKAFLSGIGIAMIGPLFRIWKKKRKINTKNASEINKN